MLGHWALTRSMGCADLYAENDRPLFETLPIQGSMFGMPHLNRPCGRIDHE